MACSNALKCEGWRFAPVCALPYVCKWGAHHPRDESAVACALHMSTRRTATTISSANLLRLCLAWKFGNSLRVERSGYHSIGTATTVRQDSSTVCRFLKARQVSTGISMKWSRADRRCHVEELIAYQSNSTALHYQKLDCKHILGMSMASLQLRKATCYP